MAPLPIEVEKLIEEIELLDTNADDELKKLGQELKQQFQAFEQANSIVGVIGNSGVGKSSLINSLLEIPRLVPTSPNHACTAVVTVISYCNGRDKYAAQIHHLTKDEWSSELENMRESIKDASNDSAISKAKLKAVYPKADLDDLNINELLEKTEVKQRLGTQYQISTNDLDDFSKRIRPYIESAQYASAYGHLEPQYWPLIKLVKIYVPSPILRDGLALADLPGSLDSNPARAAVAQKYMRDCCRRLVVSDVVRTLTDKTTADLLHNEVAQRQLKMDGGVNSVTIVCTKTDVLTVDEIAGSSLDPNGELKKLSDEIREQEAKIRKLETQLFALEGKQEASIKNRYFASFDSIPRYEMADPLGRHLKYALNRDTFEPEKRLKMSSPSEDVAEKEQQPSRGEVASSNDKIIAIKNARNDLALEEEQLHKMKAQHWMKGLTLRNNDTKTRFRNDFVEMIKEMDEDDAENDPEFDGFVPRDYSQLANDLEVFCVSTKGYQQLQGWLPNEKESFFGNTDQTEIPALKDHLMRISAEGLKRDARRRHLLMRRYLASLALHCRNHDPSEYNAAHVSAMDEKLREFHQNIASSNNQLKASLEKEWKHVTSLFGTAVKNANEALSVVNQWTAERKSGGLPWNTLRAICRRQGCFKAKAQTWNLNDDLASPIMKTISGRWEWYFGSMAIKCFDQHLQRICSAMDSLQKHLVTTQSGAVELCNLIQEKLETTKKGLEEPIGSAKEALNSIQGDASRIIPSRIQQGLKETYDRCVKTRGKGCALLMKERLKVGIEAKADAMFRDALAQVDEIIRVKGTPEVIQKLRLQQDIIIDELEKDYARAMNQSQRSLPPLSDEFKARMGALISEARAVLDVDDTTN